MAQKNKIRTNDKIPSTTSKTIVNRDLGIQIYLSS